MCCASRPTTRPAFRPDPVSQGDRPPPNSTTPPHWRGFCFWGRVFRGFFGRTNRLSNSAKSICAGLETEAPSLPLAGRVDGRQAGRVGGPRPCALPPPRPPFRRCCASSPFGRPSPQGGEMTRGSAISGRRWRRLAATPSSMPESCRKRASSAPTAKAAARARPKTPRCRGRSRSWRADSGPAPRPGQ